MKHPLVLIAVALTVVACTKPTQVAAPEPPPELTKTQTLTLAVGVSSSVALDRSVFKVETQDKSIVGSQLIRKEGEIRSVLLLPFKTGDTELLVLDDNEELIRKYQIKVVSNQRHDVIQAQTQRERDSGHKVEEKVMQVSDQLELELPRAVGPIFLTDPNVLDFKRVLAPEGEALTHKLWVIAKGEGTTDLTVHDEAGEEMTRLIVQVNSKAQ